LNPSNAVALSYELWRLQQERYEIAVIDDADRLMRSDTMIGMMKNAWNSDGPKVNCFISERIRKNQEYLMEGSEKYRDTIPPPSFEYRLATPWFANKNVATPDSLAEFTHPDFTALIDRGLRPRWINSEPRNVFFYTLWMIDRGNLFVDLNLTMEEAQETADYFMDAAERLQHPNPNLRLAIELGKARKNPNYKTLWGRAIAESLSQSKGQPRAIDKNDLKLKPDLRRAVEEGRKEAARRKEAAERAIAEARAAAERAEAERKRREMEAAERAAREMDVVPTATVRDDPKEVELKRIVRPAKAPPSPPKPYSPPPGHVFPPAPVATPYPEPEPYDVTILSDTPPAEPESEPDPLAPPKPAKQKRLLREREALSAVNNPVFITPDDDPPKQNGPEQTRNRGRLKALRVARDDPPSWSSKVPSKFQGDCLEYGWVRLTTVVTQDDTPQITEAGRAELERLEDL
jgi:hypothetical protein